jgi:DeoR/GlpR family transcriptional regulator of sugar metabolism
MASVSREVIVMVESEKFNRKIPNLEIPWLQIHTLITDDDLSPELKEKLVEQGINLIIAN